MNGIPETTAKLREAIQPERLLDTAVRLIEVYSPTRKAAPACDRMEELLRADGFDVKRVAAGWEEASAVVARWDSGGAGRTLQFNGHLDTVHLPFVPPRVEDGILFGSGASDMKGGIAAMIEAAQAVRDADLLAGGGLLLTGHDLHESPWGDGSQVDGLIDAGHVGDAVLLPEYLSDVLPVVGRGLAVLEVEITRDGEPVHEVLGGIEQPSVIAAGAELVSRLAELDDSLREITHPLGGRESAFVGQIHAGEIFNQSPTCCKLNGTRRWLAGTRAEEAEEEYYRLAAEVADRFGVQVSARWVFTRDAFELDESTDVVQAFQAAHEAVSGRRLSPGAKPFVDDGNTFIRRGGVPAVTHGPAGTGAHTLDERVPLTELERTALVYALTAVGFCGGEGR